MQSDRIFADARTYQLAIRACCKAGQWQQGIRLMDQMQLSGPPYASPPHALPLFSPMCDATPLTGGGGGGGSTGA